MRARKPSGLVGGLEQFSRDSVEISQDIIGYRADSHAVEPHFM